MKLRHQLAVISLLTLTIPWAVIHFIEELELTLRQYQQQVLQNDAQRIAQQLARSDVLPEQIEPSPGVYDPLYAFSLPGTMILDGYDDDWQVSDAEFTTLSHPDSPWGTLHYKAGVRFDRFYLYIQLPNSHTANIGVPRLTLRFKSATGIQQRLTADLLVPGKIQVAGQPVSAIHGYWQDTPNGLQIELSLPLANIRHGLGFVISESSSQFNESSSWLGNIPANEYRVLPAIVHRNHAIEERLKDFSRPMTRVSLLDRNEWIIASQGHTRPEAYTPDWQDTPWLELSRNMLIGLFRWVMGRDRPTGQETRTHAGRRQLSVTRQALQGQSSSTWLTSLHGGHALMVSASPLNTDKGAYIVLIEQTTDDIAALSDATMVRLITLSFSLIALIILVLLGYASWLSWRITQLRNGIEAQINPEGRLVQDFQPARSRDEIGDLSRSFSIMLREVSAYTEYLEGFSRKLSHELKTPLAIVRSSLENLKLQGLSTENRIYLDRADDGAQRLSQILHAMSEASRLEKSIESTERERFSLTEVVENVGEAYRQLLKDHSLQIDIPRQELFIEGSPELIAQLLDKLIDNARDFTPEGEQIRLILRTGSTGIDLIVENPGPTLPPHLSKEIFSSFVSLRSEKANSGHMGLGLVIARLISDFHQAKIWAENIDHPTGVRMVMRIPKALSK